MDGRHFGSLRGEMPRDTSSSPISPRTMSAASGVRTSSASLPSCLSFSMRRAVAQLRLGVIFLSPVAETRYAVADPRK